MSVFCESCGTPMNVKAEKGDKTVYVCPVCNAEKTVKKEDTPKAENVVEIKTKERKPEFIDESEFKQEGTLVSEPCPECDNERVWVVTQQTRAADEPPTRIYHCPECGATWREYS